MTNDKKHDPLDELLRARLRIPVGADLRLRALCQLMKGVDWISRTTTGQAFFALNETERILLELDERTGHDLVRAVLAMNGGTVVKAHGLENIPASGPVIIGSTHPIGTFDFLAHAGALLDHRSDLKVVAGREAERFLGRDLIVPVDLDRQDKVLTARQTRAGMLAHLEQEGALLVFGSGRVPTLKDGLLIEPPWRTGVTRVSAESGAPIVPASANMRNSRHYYRTRRLAALLGGGNDEFGRRVASLRYVSELISKLGGTYNVYYGPIQPAGTAPDLLKELSEGLVPGLYKS
ncbi:1-acyl-sn-glycerol-3-phosphate acyltransferase [Ruegeria atlantica]|uniref:1-acyl-sn-glycerol-3-phosphate acyltransferase n=1 Tax=Ruegeria atlantica TaxID=81569 RepID=UPI00249571CB|nr:1-acyl-sn-glycerol-3-phosphate acyltransferase [Ruegeria atlantica]